MPRRYGVTGFQQVTSAPPTTPPVIGRNFFHATKDLIYVMNVLGADVPIASNYIASRGVGLVTNGSGMLPTNYNFESYYTRVPADHPVGAGASYQYYTANAGAGYADELIAVDPAGAYDMTFAYRQVADDGARTFYSFLAPYDADKLNISTTNYMEQANTRTTLAAPLNNGDTVVQLTSAANWNNAAGANSYLRAIIFWNYTDGQGYTWPPGTYSRNRSASDIYADGAISGNTITLRAAWNGGSYPAGTAVGNGAAGGDLMYGASNVRAPATWTNFGPYRYSGVHTDPTLAATSKFPQATSYVKVGFLHNYTGNVAGMVSRVANIQLTGAAAAARQGPPKGGTAGQYLIKNSSTDYDTSWATAGGGPPSGAAGGDLTGSYPNPTIAAGKVTSAAIADGTIVDADVSASAAIQQSKIAGLSGTVNDTGWVSLTPASGTGTFRYRVVHNIAYLQASLTGLNVASNTSYILLAAGVIPAQYVPLVAIYGAGSSAGSGLSLGVMNTDGSVTIWNPNYNTGAMTVGRFTCIWPVNPN